MQLKVPTVLLALLVVTAAFGTAQAPDRLLLDGKFYRLNTNPLDSYFEDHPDLHPREADDGDRVVLSTALWRGYIATFEVVGNVLRIQDFEVSRWIEDENEELLFEDELVSEIERFFPTSESRLMDWYTGIMVLPTGELKQYVHLSYASVFESYVLLRVEDGKVTDSAKLTGEEFVRFKRKQFAVFRESDEYLRVLDELRDDGDDEYFLESFVFDLGEFVEHVMLNFDEAKDE